ncbi:MAG: DUF3043 domain-containing protein [Actinomycetota bacterium]|nr:DUF3043 domain-containing protein [Actinomycetota bacterium]
MKLLPKRPVPTVAGEVIDETALPAAGAKGRPTPKRRDSAVQRGPVSAPKTRKEAYARQKQQAKAAKVLSKTPAANLTPQQRRAAIRSGDPSALPRRDQGATRKLARDYVDSHRMASNYLLLLFPLMIASYFAPYIQFAVIVVFLGLIVEWNLTGRKIRKLAIERHGDADGSAMTIGFYAGSRAYLPRRWRLPAPQVQQGADI